MPGFNRPYLLEECLASMVSELEFVEPGTVEIVVTDDHSPDRRATAVACSIRFDSRRRLGNPVRAS